MTEKYTVIDFFGAPGGLSFGFEMAGFKSIGALDIFKAGMETYQFNFPDSKILIEDIKKVSVQDLKKEFGISKENIDIVIGGPPCQGFSTIGRVKIASLARNGTWKLNNHHPRFIDDPRNELYKEFIRMVKGLKPKIVVMENVPGMMSYRNGEIVREIIEDFNSIGYTAQARILNAVEYGVPQLRKRIFFIAVRKDLKIKILWPEPTHTYSNSNSMSSIGPLFKKKKLKPAVTVWEAIGDLPSPVPGKPKLADVALNYDKEPFSEYQKWARQGSKEVHNHITRQHNERDIKVFSLMKEGEKWKDLPEEIRKSYGYRDDIFNDKFKKLKRDEPSWTVVAHLYKDGYMYIHPVEARTITVREAARLQSFPDTFIFKGSRTDQFKQVGNAVPPLLAKAVALCVKKMLENIK
ncbi:MAG: DNA cytosine methyltransferase [Thermodesulfobacterium sp.]|nr:DNA cytosine methyltransferase [Thermodesulfobacterium sp.]